MKLKKISKKAIIILVVAAIGIGTAGYFGVTNAQKSNQPETILREYKVTRGDITAGVSGQGVLRYESAPQNFSEAVVVGELLVKQGQAVKAGDRLVKADEQKLNEAYEQAQTELEKARIALKQAQSAKTLEGLNAQKENVSQEAGGAETGSQLAQAKSAAQALSQKVDGLKGQLAQLEAQIASLPENDPQLADLNEQKGALQTELESAQGELDSANSDVSSLENAKNKQDEAQAKNNAIDKKIANANASSLNDAIALAKLDVEEAQKKADKLKAIKDDPYLYASVGGVVLSLDAAVGAETKTDAPVATIGDPGKKTINVPISQSDIGTIEEGQEAEFTLDAFGDQKFAAKVLARALVPIKDSNPVSYNVSLEVAPNDAEMLDGMSANATMIVKQQKDVLQLSNKAIFVENGKQYVRMQNEDGTLRKVEIETGFSDGKVSEITGGLKEGDVAVVEG